MKKIISLLPFIFSLALFLNPTIAFAQSCSCFTDPDGICQISDPSGCPSGTTPTVTSCNPQFGICGCSCVQTGGNGTEIEKEYVGPGCVKTSLGCIGVGSAGEFIQKILTIAIGIGGGIAFLLMILGTYQVLTSSGDPKRLQAGKELITSAVAGLLLIVFGVFILRVLGADILELPDFGS